jgi:hypothetical protein
VRDDGNEAGPWCLNKARNRKSNSRVVVVVLVFVVFLVGLEKGVN